MPYPERRQLFEKGFQNLTNPSHRFSSGCNLNSAEVCCLCLNSLRSEQAGSPFYELPIYTKLSEPQLIQFRHREQFRGS